MGVSRVHEQVLEDPHAGDSDRWRGYVVDSQLGLCDAAAADPDEAMDRARRRWRRRRLGVEWAGCTLPADAADPERGQIAMNGCRFALWRRVGEGDGIVCWVMLNPSTADHRSDDATLRRITRYTQDWGYGWLTVGNLWPYRATDPADLRRWLDERQHQIGHVMAENDQRVLAMARQASVVIAAWSAHGTWEGRAREMRALFAQNGIEACGLAATRSGEPAHPLRLAATCRPVPLDALGRRRA